MAKVWKAREASVKILPAASVTISGTGTSLATYFTSGSSIDADMKGVEITEPELSVEKIDLLGNDTNGFQNADVEEKPAGMAKLTGTLVLRGDESAIELNSYESGTSVASTYTRYQVSNGTRKKIAVLVTLDDGTDGVYVALADAFITTKDVKLTGADGHFERSVEITTLPKNYYLEFKN
jgi:hypothetical protein